MNEMTLTGPFSEVVTMRQLPLFGPLADGLLEVIPHGGVVLHGGVIADVGVFSDLRRKYPHARVEEIAEPMVLMPGMVDAHTHMCWAGDRATDYAMRLEGKSYLEIAQSGGGILSTVRETRKASEGELVDLLVQRCDVQLKNGVTTCEVKSGYGLNVDAELKMLRVIREVNQKQKVSLMATCLAAHTRPPEFATNKAYLDYLVRDLLPLVKAEALSDRVDIFVEQSAFGVEEARNYLEAAVGMGFGITIHADQFTIGGSGLAAEFKALSADHLEASSQKEIDLLAKALIPGVLLPGACMGLGMSFPKGRQMLDSGMCIAIASDWNPGSAPMGDLLMQASVFGVAEKLTTAETLAAITVRAAHTLNLHDRGVIESGKAAKMIAFPCKSHKEILYHQGAMKAVRVWG